MDLELEVLALAVAELLQVADLCVDHGGRAAHEDHDVVRRGRAVLGHHVGRDEALAVLPVRGRLCVSCVDGVSSKQKRRS